MTDPLTGYVRVKAVCVFSNDGKILAVRDHDPFKRQSFWVPVGGRVEFGEKSGQAIAREVIEELSIEAADLRLLGVLDPGMLSIRAATSDDAPLLSDLRLLLKTQGQLKYRRPRRWLPAA